MKKNFVKKLSVALAMAMAVSTLAPAATADAAADPTFKSYKASVYENASSNGVYTYTVKNIKKGYTVKWAIAGPGKKYVSLKTTTTKATGTTVSNKITVDTNGDAAAANAKVYVRAQVYNGTKKVGKRIGDTVAIKVAAKGVDIVAADGTNFETTVGTAYDLNATLTPANTTSALTWSVEGTDATIDADGIFKATKTGEYTVTAATSAKGVVDTQKIVVKSNAIELASVEQTASNAFVAKFTGNASQKFTKDDFSVVALDGTSVIAVKTVDFSADGSSAKVTTYGNFIDGVTYNVTCGDKTTSFVATVGAVARIQIDTVSAQENVKTPIEFTLFDANNIDVTPSIVLDANCIVTITGTYSGADLDKASEASITMNSVNSTAEVTVSYNTNAVGAQDVIATQTITCVDAKAVIGTKVFANTAVTNGNSGCAKFYLGLADSIVEVEENNTTSNVFFCAKDANGDVVNYDSYEAESSNDDIMTVSVSKDSGKYAQFSVTGNNVGNALINITAMKNGKPSYYTVPVSVVNENVAVKMTVSVDRPVMSNVNDGEYKGSIDATLYDINGEEVLGTFDYELITQTTGTGLQLGTGGLDANEYRAINAVAKTYTIKVTGADNETGKTFVKNVNVTVKALPDAATAVSGSGIKVTYQIELANGNVLDQNPADSLAKKTVSTRLYATYNGLFAGYVREVSGTINVANGNVLVHDDSELDSATVVVKYGNLSFDQTTELLGTGLAGTPESIGSIATTYDSISGASTIDYNEVDATGKKVYTDLARTGLYTIEYELTYAKDTSKTVKKTQTFTVKNTVVVPTVSVTSRKAVSLAEVTECLKTNVDMNNDTSEYASIIAIYDANAGAPTLDANNKVTVKYAEVEDVYGAQTWNFWVPINTTFTVE